jgi:hypothetical protein
MAGNLVADSILLRRRADGQQGWDPYYLNIDLQEGYLHVANSPQASLRELAGNHIVPSDPGFARVAGRRITFRDSSAVRALGFKEIPFEKIGPLPDAYRAKRGAPLRLETP